MKLHKLQIEIGKLGEAFVYEKECETKFRNLIDEKKALIPSNGYDILSYDPNSVVQIHIETTTGTEKSFYMSNHELEIAKKMNEKKGLIYLVYFVSEVTTDNPKIEVINDITSNEDYIFFEYKWHVTKK